MKKRPLGRTPQFCVCGEEKGKSLTGACNIAHEIGRNIRNRYDIAVNFNRFCRHCQQWRTFVSAILAARWNGAGWTRTRRWFGFNGEFVCRNDNLQGRRWRGGAERIPTASGFMSSAAIAVSISAKKKPLVVGVYRYFRFCLFADNMAFWTLKREVSKSPFFACDYAADSFTRALRVRPEVRIDKSSWMKKAEFVNRGAKVKQEPAIANRLKLNDVAEYRSKREKRTIIIYRRRRFAEIHAGYCLELGVINSVLMSEGYKILRTSAPAVPNAAAFFTCDTTKKFRALIWLEQKVIRQNVVQIHLFGGEGHTAR